MKLEEFEAKLNKIGWKLVNRGAGVRGVVDHKGKSQPFEIFSKHNLEFMRDTGNPYGVVFDIAHCKMKYYEDDKTVSLSPINNNYIFINFYGWT